MGHIRLGVLPRTYRWLRVIELLEQGESTEQIAQATYWAAYHGLQQVPTDAGFTHTLTTVFQFVDGLQARDPAAALREKGFAVPSNPTLLDFVGTFKDRADADAAFVRSKSDIATIAQDSFAQVLVNSAGPALSNFFGTGSGELTKALHENFKGKPLSTTMHEFFATFTQQYLNYHLGRELPNHVGAGKAFSNTSKHAEFAKAFDLYVRQTVRITDEFTSGWFGKAKWEGRLSHQQVSQFAHHAFKKIRGEFRRGAQAIA